MTYLRRFLFAFLVLSLPHAAWAAGLTAAVEEQTVTTDEPFALQLTLTGADAKGDPDLKPLNPDFTIVAEGRSSETNIVNGHMTSSIGWQITLLPRRTGRMTLPALSVVTEAGTLSSQPITLEAMPEGLSAGQNPASMPSNAPAAGPAVTMTASVTEAAPYRDQPVIYTLHFVARENVSDIAPGDVKADNAIVTPQGQPVVRDGMERGEPVKLIDFHYLVTPVQAGPITIQPVTLQGRVERQGPAPHLPRPGSGLGRGGMMDPFDLMQALSGNGGGFPGMVEMRPFSVTSNAVTLDVRAPVAGVEPWLPLTGLELKEAVDLDGPFRVGEPVIRRLTLTAQGIGGDQLPDLAARDKADGLKVYADKPITQTDSARGMLVGSRSESLNLIPTAPGPIELPAITVQWYDTVHHEVKTAEVPSHRIDVLPGAAAPTAPPVPATVVTPLVAASAPVAAAAPGLPDWVWGVGAVGLLALLGLAFRLGRGSRRRLDDVPRAVTDVDAPPRPAVMAWDAVRNPSDLRAALAGYARAHWDLNAHRDLESSFAAGPGLTDAERAEGCTALRALDGAIYGGQAIDSDALKAQLKRAVAARDRKTRMTGTDSLPPLNPA